MTESNSSSVDSDDQSGGQTVSPTRISLRKVNRVLLMLIRSFLIALLIVAVGSYIILSPPMLTILFPGLILHPWKPDPKAYQLDEVAGIKPQDVYFKNSSNDTLHGWYFQSANAQAPVLLLNHGNGCDISQNIPALKRILLLGPSVFSYDYRGYGKSTGKATVAGALADGEAAYDYLRNERKIDPANIILYGGSFGGAVACHLASTKPARALIIESAFSSLLREGKEKVTFLSYYPDFLQPIPALDNTAVLRAKHPPLLIVHGTLDTMISFSQAEENFKEASEPKTLVVLPHSGHYVDDADVSVYRTGMKSFLDQLRK